MNVKKLKQKIKKNRLYRKWRRSRLRENIKAKQLNRNPKKVSNYFFKKHYKRNINWDEPTLFDEKLMVLKCTTYLNNKLVINCTDKYRVREYVERCGLGSTLNELYGVWKTPDEIDIKQLPDSFVLKRNNDAGGVLVVANKSSEQNLDSRIRRLGVNQNRKYGVVNGEIHYQHISPCIICEKYIGKDDGSFPYDYKFFCMNGKVRSILVCLGRESEDTLDRFMVDREFQLLSIMPDEPQHTNDDIQQYKPALFEQMIETAEILAKEFPFVRVDLYEFKNRIIFGELTFTPMGCINDYFSMEGQKMLGDWLSV